MLEKIPDPVWKDFSLFSFSVEEDRGEDTGLVTGVFLLFRISTLLTTEVKGELAFLLVSRSKVRNHGRTGFLVGINIAVQENYI